MKQLIITVLVVIISAAAHAQSPEEGATEVQVWTSGGHSVPGGRGNTGIWNAGLRYGWVLTYPHGPGFLNGRFEYAIDAVPVYLIFQPTNTAYGLGLNPMNLKWNFTQRSGHFAPYIELSGGTLFTTSKVPPRTSSVNFTPSVALGTHLLGKEYAWAIEARYLHISNAGLGDLNPGINTLEVRLGIGKFRKK